MDFLGTGLSEGLRRQQFHTPVTVRDNYGFIVPFGDSPKTVKADVAVFSSAIPSVQSAIFGFFDFSASDEIPAIQELSALGAPEVAYLTNGRLYEIRFKESSKFDVNEVTEKENWISRKINDITNLLDNPIGFELTRSLISQAAKNSLLDRLNALFSLLTREEGVQSEGAIRLSFAVINSLMLGVTSEDPIVNKYCRKIHEQTRFENIPPSTLAEAYEQFGISDHTRRKSGVVYTPAWLAKFAVSQIPQNVLNDRSISFSDPACGSGTFLVALIERLALGRSVEDFRILNIVNRIHGRDIDSLAVYITRLSLNYITQNLGIGVQNWDIKPGDSTIESVDAQWVIGNLPFGYRSHGARDLSNVILEKIISKNVEGMSIILPESFSYNVDAIKTRKSLLDNYCIKDLYLIPDNTYKSGTERTILIEASRGRCDSFRLRALSLKRRYRHQNGIKPTSFVELYTSLGNDLVLPVSPFDAVLQKALIPSRTIGDEYFTRTGTKLYGKEKEILASKAKKVKILRDPSSFWELERGINDLSEVPDDPKVFYNKGPWELLHRPKLIIRSTVKTKYRSRMVAYLDRQKIAFTDKFTGIWHNSDSIEMLGLLSIYLQTDFAVAWMRARNPSRKLRNYILESMPLPNFKGEEWDRLRSFASDLTLINPPHESALLFDNNSHSAVLIMANEIVNSEFGIKGFAAETLKLIQSPDEVDSLIASARDMQLAEEYSIHSKNLSTDDKLFLEYSGSDVVGDKN